MFRPDYRNIEDAARNIEAKRVPLYDHKVDHGIIGKLMKEDIEHKFCDDADKLDEFFRVYDRFFAEYGYDTVTFELCITRVLPFGGALANPRPGYLDSREKFESYPWDKVKDIYIQKFDKYFAAMVRHIPEGMKAIGGVGNGVFEIAQDLAGYENLCVMGYEEPELHAQIFEKIGDVMTGIWEWFLAKYGKYYCVARFGDDLGFKSNTLIGTDDIKTHILPQYKRVIDLVHSAGLPFLLHSCGNIFNVMEDIISVGIDAKHSNEDQIADFYTWVEKYGDRIGNFGGVDTDHLCRMENESLKQLVTRLYTQCGKGHGGFALGCGNSIAPYVDPEKYLIMLNTVRQLRGDFD